MIDRIGLTDCNLSQEKNQCQKRVFDNTYQFDLYFSDAKLKSIGYRIKRKPGSNKLHPGLFTTGSVYYFTRVEVSCRTTEFATC